MNHGGPIAAGEDRRLEPADIGGWLFRCRPRNLEWTAARIGPIDSRCAVRSYRLDLIQPGHPVVAWLTGPNRATPTPGVWMVGYTTGLVADDPSDRPDGPPRARVHLTGMTQLPAPLPRAHLAAHPPTASLEVLRQPFGPNPSYLTPAEQTALDELLGGWPAGWSPPIGATRDLGNGYRLAHPVRRRKRKSRQPTGGGCQDEVILLRYC